MLESLVQSTAWYYISLLSVIIPLGYLFYLFTAITFEYTNTRMNRQWDQWRRMFPEKLKESPREDSCGEFDKLD
ncbi:Hypp3214 [Branchiostoma lanceolatum]|uniref:Hypp3214 protein n=1 Tax=Branchiostoma lanceolatum TaxID=7740 RepID=A0A8K0A130_BRALA|nr:Hypp3214 [Branchiostoma lanceolatum]